MTPDNGEGMTRPRGSINQQDIRIADADLFGTVVTEMAEAARYYADEERESAGLSPRRGPRGNGTRDLARLTGIPKSVVSDWTTGRVQGVTRTHLESLRKMCGKLAGVGQVPQARVYEEYWLVCLSLSTHPHD